MGIENAAGVAEEIETLAKDYLDTANGALRLAHKQDFNDPQIIETASQCLMRSLELKPDYVEAIIAVAYVSALLGLQQRAEDALNQAQNLAPKDPRIQVLRKEFQNYFKQSQLLPPKQVALDKVLSQRLAQNLAATQGAEDDMQLDFFNQSF